MDLSAPLASIVVPTYNGEKYLAQLLEMIRRQKIQPLEMVVIDSGSTDSTMRILQQFNISVASIAQSEFSHSATRNMAATICTGKYVVFLTQDAVPADSCWLERLLKPFQEYENVAGTYGRHIPRPNANLLEANDIHQIFSAERLIKRLSENSNSDRQQIWKMISFSNASAAYDRQLLLENPFDVDLDVAEDQEWAYRMLKQSYSIVYEPESVVLHSHDHTLKEKYVRSLSMGKSFSQFMYPTLGWRSILLESGAWVVHVLRDLLYIISSRDRLKSKIKWLLLSPVHRAATHYAFRKGWNSGQHQKTDRSIKQDRQASLKT